MKPKTKRLALAVALTGSVIVYALLLWRGPWWVDGAHLRTKNLEPADGVVITGFRTSLVALGVGFIAGLGLYYTHRSHQHTEKLFQHTRQKDREQAELTREGQVTERYVEAIKLLSSENLTQQLGGIYALERIRGDSEKDRVTVNKVLAAFIRHHAACKEGEGTAEAEAGTRPGESVQAALSILISDKRRPQFDGGLNLAGVDLRGADIRYGRLHLTDLRNARLEGANMVGADLDRSDLSGANLRGTDLDNANLRGAKLTGVTGLFRGQLLRAVLGASRWSLNKDGSPMTLPQELAADQAVQDHIARCDVSGLGLSR
ncbi:hypothetical protein QFZ24_005169 [Streptomyces phaeochromogenes]|jgi:hypothetical protein|uniref:pentapeptide repeat-containing protein n=1 Tax=Streptomyces phaeochromogenes TaxID=1923 RepID=UPI00278FC55A|nr:pentapeptide repeat-containing protein [Streptomyces phaeochromogenes]MDQ0951246.1 hypothetical protein [Streptomyces phaeochromogenes]